MIAIDWPGEERLSAKLRLDKSTCLLIGTVCLPERNRVLLAVSPHEPEVYPGSLSIETPLLYDVEIPRTNFTILAHS